MRTLVRTTAIAALVQAAACAGAPTAPTTPTAAEVMPVSGGPANTECRAGYLVASGRDCEKN